MQTRSRIPVPLLSLLLALGAAAPLSGCGSEEPADDGAGGGPGADADGTEPLYALLVQVYDQNWDRNVYPVLTTSLDDIANADLDGAREFPGVANFIGLNGRLLVSSGEAPTITEYSISDDLEWTVRREIGFSDYPLDDNANFYGQFLLDDHTAYLPFEETSRLIWDPTDMEIVETLEDSALAIEKDGLRLRAGGNRNGIQFDGPVQRAFFYTNEDWTEFGPESAVAFYDPETHEEERVITLPCPGLSMPSQDELGYTYYATWDFAGAPALHGEDRDPCIARLTPEGELDEAFTTNLTEYTDGRYVNNFRYVGGGRAIANVLHHEELSIDFETAYDPETLAAINESGPHWRFWLFDLEAGTAAPVEGVEVEVGSGAQFAVLDGRTFLFLPYQEWGRSKIYELNDDGSVTELLDTVGDVFKWVRVR